MQIPSAIPRESLLGKREGDFREIPLTVSAILDENAGAGRLSLNPTQQLPLNAFVPLDRAAREHGTGASERVTQESHRCCRARQHAVCRGPLRRRPDRPDGRRGRRGARRGPGRVADAGRPRFADRHDPARLRFDRERSSKSSTTPVPTAAVESAKRLGMSTSPVLAYLANELINAKDPKKLSMYSIVAGLDPVTTKTPPSVRSSGLRSAPIILSGPMRSY